MARKSGTLIVFLLVAASVVVLAQRPGGRMGRRGQGGAGTQGTQPGGAQGGDDQAAGRMKIKPTAVTHNGNPALRFEVSEGWGVYVETLTRQGEPAIGFPASFQNCMGEVYITRTRVSGDLSGGGQNCQSFDLPRSDVQAERQKGYAILTTNGGNYNAVPVAEGPNGKRSPVPGIAIEFLVRGINNFDITYGNLRRVYAGLQQEAQGGTQPQGEPTQTTASKNKGKTPPPPDKAPPPKDDAVAFNVSSDPGNVQVYVNDEPRGMTSEEGRLVLRLKPGTYKVRMDMPGYKEWEQSVKVEANKPGTVQAKLETLGPPPFTAKDITEMLKGHMTSKRIETLVGERGVDFELTADLEKQFKADGATSDLLLAIATNHKK